MHAPGRREKAHTADAGINAVTRVGASSSQTRQLPMAANMGKFRIRAAKFGCEL